MSIKAKNLFIPLIMMMLASLLGGFSALASPSDDLQADPPIMPHQVFGLVRVNGVFVPEGILVSAWCGGVKIVERATEDYEGQSWYLLDIPPDDLATPQKDGCISGELISFKIAERDADQTLAWSANGITEFFDLTAMSPPPEPHRVSGLVRLDDAFVDVGTPVSAWCGGVMFIEVDTVIDQAGQSTFSLAVPGNDPFSAGVQGCASGELISFKISNWLADQTLPWAEGNESVLDLSASTLVNNDIFLPLIMK